MNISVGISARTVSVPSAPGIIRAGSSYPDLVRLRRSHWCFVVMMVRIYTMAQNRIHARPGPPAPFSPCFLRRVRVIVCAAPTRDPERPRPW